ncbi:MAG: hypothetical protein FWB86_05710 [Treponema sp.]|nr:hypothetical protein [Treponema sp.]MCL2251739.1 hypothetical protein [Treponema sp.]
MINIRNYKEPKEANYSQRKALGPISDSRTGELCPDNIHAYAFFTAGGAVSGDFKIKLGLLFL